MLKEWLSRFHFLMSPKPTREIDDELQFHIERQIQENVAAGMTPQEARRRAVVEFGAVEGVRSQSHEQRPGFWLETVFQDLRYSLRMLSRSPAFTAVAIGSLALGIGANTAIFSFLDAVLLRNLPVQQPQQLVLLGNADWSGVADGYGITELYSYPFYRELEKNNSVFSDTAAILSMANPVYGVVSGRTQTEPMKVQLVSGTYFPTLGVRPLMGRVLTDEDDRTEGNHPVAVVSYAWWNGALAHNPGVLSRKLKLGSTVFDIVGVAPPEFFGTNVGRQPDIWVPMSMTASVPPGWGSYSDKRSESMYILGRLRPGVSLAQATSNIDLLFHQIWLSYRDDHTNQQDLTNLQKTHLPLTPIPTGMSGLRGTFSQPLQMLMALTGIVLLIACANIANLLLARATARAREFAVRQALGAKRSRLIRQLLTESLLLATLGGALGIALSMLADRLLLCMVSTGADMLPLDVSIHPRVLLFTLAVTVCTAVLFGTLPALRATHLELTDALKDGRNSAGKHMRSPLAKSLIITQVAFSLVLLVGAGLFVRSLINLSHIDTGFNRENTLVMNLDPSSIGYKDDQPRLTALYQQIEQRIATVHGVTAASFASFTFGQGSWTSSITIPGVDPATSSDVKHDVVGDDYFKAMKIPLIAGRGFGPQDTATSPKVSIISESFAKLYFPNANPIGRTFHIGGSTSHWDMQIIGVAKDVKFRNLNEKSVMLDYVSYSQRRQYLQDFVVRYDGDSAAISTAVQNAIHSIDANLPITRVTSLEAQVSGSITQQRTVAQLSAFFGMLAVFLSCIGIYGLMSYMVSRRTNEIGVRMALGARRSSVSWLILREILLLVGIGVAIGVPVTLACSRLVTNMLFGIRPTDAASVIGSVFVLLAVGLLSGWGPARRASHTNPMEALRHE